ncbi:penicillin-binding protein 1C [Reichenbachiella versicolor]|uniref:penicillin-binding protein 1C n=1 Tax=Reichenbachiella versicolor TaxID=1821036 RepID=UPI001C884A6F|nr:penicillin-binding protein 1C [Reichenbachiella versicolor]
MRLYESIKRYKKALILLIGSVLFLLLLPLPSPLFAPTFSTTIETQEGELLGAQIAKDGQWRFPKEDSIATRFEMCLLQFEDAYFYKHFGVNPISLSKAFWSNIQSGRIKRGGSTISMQVVRMALGNQSRTLWQKILETLMVFKLELLYSKKEILSHYVSQAPFGGNVVGVSAASWRYYGRPSHLLSWGEAASLAVLPNSPSLVFPGKNESTYKWKRDFLLSKLLVEGVIDSLTCELAMAEPLPGIPQPMPQLAPRLLTRLINEGKGGKRNIVTIDAAIQAVVKERVEAHSQGLQSNFIFNAAALVIDIESGQTKAYVGNVNSGMEHGEDVDIVTAQRSTGSLLKPFLYAAALDHGLITPKALLEDYPMFLKDFMPKNFDLKYRGAVHADEALTRSLNLPFVVALRDYGIERFHEKLKSLGMNSLTRPASHYGLSLILGGAESSLWEIAQMYGNIYRTYRHSFNRPVMNLYDAEDYKPHSILIADSLKSRDVKTDEVLSIASIWATLDAMKGLNRPQGFSGWESFRGAVPISWKTGTSFGFRDAWSVGINGKYLVAVWTGNADGEGRPGLVGGLAAAPLMFKIFKVLDHDSFNEVPTAETQLFKICKTSGWIASPNCEETEEVSWPQAVRNTQACMLHHRIHLDETETYQVNSSCYPIDKIHHKNWFVLPPTQAWYYQQNNIDYKSLPAFMKGCESDEQLATIQLIYPKKGTKIFIPKELDGKRGEAIFEAAHLHKNKRLFWHLDGEYIGETNTPHQMAIQVSEGTHQVILLNEMGEELIRKFDVLSGR